ncbi:MAG: NAD-dependent DNA ligase LigA, partial [Anaerovoracaceae bacterium]|nr:NAD-dependent DNA ligase LigA [Anaerovoracaceae bacterium]
MDISEKKERIRELTAQLNEAAEAYYKYSREIMSNFEYDRLYDELEALEKETGIILAGSPTQNVGYEILTELPKEAHPQRMLSLDKTKDVDQLRSWLGDKTGLLSWKMDGLTVVLTYEEGRLAKAVTRGNGEVGEVITANARTFVNLPVVIPYNGRVVLRGEAIITYSDFEKINESIPEMEAKYKNPRNLCSGSVRQLNSRITAERNVRFKAFALVEGEGTDGSETDTSTSRKAQMEWMASQGFETVFYREVTGGTIGAAVEEFAREVKDNDEPSDGLVLIFEDIAFGRSLGTTAKFPRDSIAFKWQDEVRETVLREIQWSASRTGLINPVAVFDPVELEGTTVSRASVHNVSIMKELGLGIGDTITVYKANMIIPQIADNLTRSSNCEPPEFCPVCGMPTVLKNDSGVEKNGKEGSGEDSYVETLYCTNKECPAKKIKAFSHFVSRNALNIDGLSESTIEKLTAGGFIKEAADFFRLEQYRDKITEIGGLGEKSFDNLITSVNTARHTTPARLLFALGIPGIGSANAGVIARACGNDWEKMIALDIDELTEIDGIGEVMAGDYVAYFSDEENLRRAQETASELIFEKADEKEQTLEGMTFVITGSLTHFSNRKQLQEMIEERGGKAAGSVSKKTSYLINNDSESSSSK